MQPDGTGARVLTKGEDDLVPVVSPDGRWIYYFAAATEGRVMRVSSDGGDRESLEIPNAWPIAVSSDNRFLLTRDNQQGADGPMVVWDIETRRAVAQVALPADVRASWGRRPDVITYVLTRDGVGNLWEQPIQGGPPRQLTKFTSGLIFTFAYSPDTRRLFIARGQRTGDVVLLRNFR